MCSNAEDKNYTKDFAERLRKAFEVAGVRPIDVARFLDVSPVTVSRWLAGKRMPNWHTLYKICLNWNISPTYIVIGKGNPVFLLPLERRTEEFAHLTGKGETFLKEQGGLVEDAPLVAIISFLRNVWKRGDPKERVWLEIQFSKCFPDFVEWRRMREEEGEKKVVVKGD